MDYFPAGILFLDGITWICKKIFLSEKLTRIGKYSISKKQEKYYAV